MTATAPEMQTVNMTIREALNQALFQAMEFDDTVVVFGEDVEDPIGGVTKITEGLTDRFGKSRVRDTPISEVAIAGAALGAAVGGLRPIGEIMIMDFIALSIDQLLNHAAKLYFMTDGAAKVPLTIRTMPGGNNGAGATHGQSLEAWFMHSPGMKIAYPSTPYDAKGLLDACIFDDDPCLHLESIASVAKSPVGVERYSLPVGIADVKRRGSDVTLISYGPVVLECLTAAQQLEADGISAEVVDLRWLVPLDRRTVLESVAKTRRAVIAHQATLFCGPGAEIAAQLNAELFGQLLAPVERVGAPYVPIPVAAELREQYFISAEAIVAAAKRTCSS
jgi:acetoin:2,6-dichlorophenolindophenol oxidoreductase subunit beta